MRRHAQIMPDFIVGNIVVLPFDETGKIVKIVNDRLDWFPYKVKLLTANSLFGNKVGQIKEYKTEQLEHER